MALSFFVQHICMRYDVVTWMATDKLIVVIIFWRREHAVGAQLDVWMDYWHRAFFSAVATVKAHGLRGDRATRRLTRADRITSTTASIGRHWRPTWEGGFNDVIVWCIVMVKGEERTSLYTR
jgi:hypothetical protein